MTEITRAALEPYREMMQVFRHDLHQHPETGFDLYRTASRVASALRDFGLEVHENIGRSGVVGVLRRGSGPHTIMLRADMDALPIQETNPVPYASQTAGTMHACGHDGHTAMLLGAAKYLADTRQFNGTVVFVFQPNEEAGLGAQAMLDDGLVGNFKPNECYAIHNLPGAPIGAFSSRVGNICASESLFEFEIFGQGGHAAMPQSGVDAILVGSELIQALQHIVARKLDPASGAVVSVTEFITDGARNILPGRGLIKGDTRARTPKVRQQIYEHMDRIAKGLGQLHGVSIEFRFQTEFTETINAKEPHKAAMKAAAGVSNQVEPDREPMSFSEDFAAFCRAVPGCFVLMGNGTTGAPLHASDYDFNDDALTIGAAFWARLVGQQLPTDPSAAQIRPAGPFPPI